MIECFFDVSSPWTWLGFEGVQRLAVELDVAVVWRPILVGGVFNAVNRSVYASRADPVPAKARYMAKDLADWARAEGLTIRFPPSVFPVSSVLVMRCACVLGQECVPFARAAFRAYWSDDRDISQEGEVRAIALEAGLDADVLLAAAGEPAAKSALRMNTDELIARGGFGSPTFFVDGDDMYFGNDRLPLIRAAILARRNGR